MIADALESLRVAVTGLAANKMRSGLTMLGVIIGVGSVIALMSIGAGAQASITDQIASVGTNLLVVMPGTVDQGQVQGAGGTAASLTYEDSQALAAQGNVPAAAAVAPEYGRSTQVIFGAANINASVTGVTAEYLDVFGLEVASGRFIESGDVAGRSNVAVLGYQAARDLFGGFDPIGQRIKIALSGDNGGRVSLTVIGVLEEKGSSIMGSADDVVFVPISAAQTRIFQGRNALGDLMVNRINVMADSEDQTEAAEVQIDRVLRDRHEIASDEDADFSVVNQADILSLATEVTDIMTVFLGAIAGISLLVGGIGIMNIMLVSVTERTREIGLRKAVGARRADILAQFLIESVVLSLMGGLVGILLGAGLAKLVDLTGLINSVVTLSSVSMAVGFSVAVGLFFGIYPASQAARLNPIEALRYE